MNINHLKFAQAVAELKSFSKAAERCFVTQPTLSNGIATLEEELGGKLFERTTRSVSLTPLGKHLFPLIEQAISDLDEIAQAAANWQNPQHKLIRIGVSPVINMREIRTLVTPFQEANPTLEFFYKECFLDDLAERLSHNQLDVLILPEGVVIEGCESQELYTEPLCYVLNSDDGALAKRNTISLEHASQGTLILTVDVCGLQAVTKALFNDHGLKLNQYPGYATSYAAVEEWADLGIGAGILPASKIISQKTEFRPLSVQTGKSATLTCNIVWKPALATTSHLQLFIKYIKQSLANRK